MARSQDQRKVPHSHTEFWRSRTLLRCSSSWRWVWGHDARTGTAGLQNQGPVATRSHCSLTCLHRLPVLLQTGLLKSPRALCQAGRNCTRMQPAPGQVDRIRSHTMPAAALVAAALGEALHKACCCCEVCSACSGDPRASAAASYVCVEALGQTNQSLGNSSLARPAASSCAQSPAIFLPLEKAHQGRPGPQASSRAWARKTMRTRHA